MSMQRGFQPTVCKRKKRTRVHAGWKERVHAGWLCGIIDNYIIIHRLDFTAFQDHPVCSLPIWELARQFPTPLPTRIQASSFYH